MVRAAARSRGAGANAAPAMTAEITAKSTKIPAATINSASRPPASQASTPEPAAPDHRLTARGRAGRCLPVRSTSGRFLSALRRLLRSWPGPGIK